MSPETQAFLDEVRDAEDPAPEVEERVLSALSATVAAGALGAGVLGASKLGKLAAAWGISGWKFGAVVVCLLAAAAADHSPPAEVTRPPVLPAVAAGPPAGAVTPAQQTAPPLPAAVPQQPRSAPARPSATARERAASLRDELSLLADVQAALQRGDGARALRLLDQHETTDRQLLAERAAARVLALCAAGKTDEARAAAAEFARAHPSSLQRSAVARSCAGR